ncbi:MAG: glycosyltransferase [Planctomycetes bacterium]|nr:glycosyltransferase [Planctomycetota bacterium]
MSTLSVVVASANAKRHLRACLESLEATLPMSSEVVVVDDASRDGTQRMVADDFPHFRLIRNAHPAGLPACLNQGARAARGAYVLFLHADTRVTGNALRAMVAFLEANLRYGAVVPRLVRPDGTTRRDHARLPGLWTPLLFGTPLERAFPGNAEVRRFLALDFDPEADGDVECPSGACLLMRRRALKKESAFDEAMGPAFHQADLCRRLSDAGWRIGYLADECVVHAGGVVARASEDYAGRYHRDRLAYYRKHYGEGAACWVKLCVAATVLEHYVLELYRRAEGWPEEPLLPVWEQFTGFLRA